VNILVPDGQPPAFVQTDFGAKTVDSSIEFPAAQSFDVDVSNERIRFTFSSCEICAWFSPNAPGRFYGFRLRNVDGSVPEIVGVSIEFDSHIGLDPSRISFDADNVFVDLEGMSIDSGFRLDSSGGCINAPPGFCVGQPISIRIFVPEFVLNVRFAAVPEPATTALMVAGLVVLACLRRRRSRL
jgi:hypothetical protein